jgi:ketosteroid isomerase-like protein
MKNTSTAAIDVDRRFFNALLGADVIELEQILADDFIIIDVMRGAVTSKSEIIQAVQSGQVKFEEIEVVDSHPRVYGNAAVVTGSTRMVLRFGNATMEVRSRYTHVYCELEGAWRLVSAQGTRITD